ncbi:MAG TPA: GNAT family N-acetyltransferase [Anaerolineales bacterium]|jgi:predicted N-acyltransferase
MTLSVHVAHSIHDLNQVEWDEFSAGRAFQSHVWYAFGEKVMGDSPATYLIVRREDRIVARATIWRIHDEPLRLPRPIQAGLHFIFRRRPLLICRSPLAETSGLILPEGPERDEARGLIIAAAQEELRRQRGSFLLFDFLGGDQLHWPRDIKLVTMPAPGTRLNIRWPSFQSYVEQRSKKGRAHYRRSIADAEKFGLQLTKFRCVNDIDTARALIENVYREHGAPINPRTRAFLQNLGTVDGTWMELRQGEKLVGCAATIRDEDVLLGTALGLAKDCHHAYFRLMYATVQDAFEHGVRTLRLGSGAYEFKQRLGFVLEDNNHVGVLGAGPVFAWLSGLAATGS